MKAKNVYIIAGPNGSGKTTFARTFLPEYAKCKNFINADLIAKGLSPFSPEQVALKAGKLVLKQIDEFAGKRIDFAFETTLSGKTYLKLFQSLKKQEYKLHIFFLWIPSAQLAVARIKDRVKQGGHNVPNEDIKRRFKRSIVNFFELYGPLSNSWSLFDNSETKPKLIAKKNNSNIDICDNILFQTIFQMRFNL
ncbi:MAG: zeta toxin family protein [Elusimicrobia bacterium]|nr:zeta toxin family protein [Elusimicrobiota bacterium]